MRKLLLASLLLLVTGCATFMYPEMPTQIGGASVVYKEVDNIRAFCNETIKRQRTRGGCVNIWKKQEVCVVYYGHDKNFRVAIQAGLQQCRDAFEVTA